MTLCIIFSEAHARDTQAKSDDTLTPSDPHKINLAWMFALLFKSRIRNEVRFFLVWDVSMF